MRQATTAISIQCRNRNCKRQSDALELRNQIVICAHCGTGQRFRVRFSADGPVCNFSVGPLEPQDDEHQAASSGALMVGWR